MRVERKVFRATFKTWEALFNQASDFATEIGPERLISISHSCDQGDGIVVVWYWGAPTECRDCGYSLTANTTGRCPECGWKFLA